MDTPPPVCILWLLAACAGTRAGEQPGASTGGTPGALRPAAVAAGGKAALDASLEHRPEGKLFVEGTRLAFGASDASAPVLLRCVVTRVDDRDHWRLATVTCDPPAATMTLVPKVAGTYVATVDGLWHFDEPPAGPDELAAETMLLPAERYPTYLRDPVGPRTWFQRWYKSGAGQYGLWCSDRVTRTSFHSWCIGHGTILQAVTVADESGRAMYTAR